LRNERNVVKQVQISGPEQIPGGALGAWHIEHTPEWPVISVS